MEKFHSPQSESKMHETHLGTYRTSHYKIGLGDQTMAPKVSKVDGEPLAEMESENKKEVEMFRHPSKIIPTDKGDEMFMNKHGK